MMMTRRGLLAAVLVAPIAKAIAPSVVLKFRQPGWSTRVTEWETLSGVPTLQAVQLYRMGAMDACTLEERLRLPEPVWDAESHRRYQSRLTGITI